MSTLYSLTGRVCVVGVQKIVVSGLSESVDSEKNEVSGLSEIVDESVLRVETPSASRLPSRRRLDKRGLCVTVRKASSYSGSGGGSACIAAAAIFSQSPSRPPGCDVGYRQWE